jgi:uncharacterized protein (DUF2141 family)
MGKNTKFFFKKNLVTITPEQKLDSGTTYSLSFRESVQDLNEGNPVEGLKLAFSTGSIIDSLYVVGSVYNILEGKDLEKMSVAIYTADTFDITKHQPSYLSRTDKKGRFSINNLKPGNYYLYTWEDKNKNLKVETNSERFGTHPIAINITINKDSIRIPVIKLDSRPLKLNSYRNISNYSIIRLNKSPIQYKLESLEEKERIISHFGDATNEIIAYPIKPNPDSTKVRLTAKDSLNNQIDTTFYIKQTKAKPLKETFSGKITKAKYTAATKKFEAELQVNLPIVNINPDSIIISADSLSLTTIKLNELTLDTIRRKVEIQKTITIPDSLITKTPTLIIRKGAFYSIFNDTLQNIEARIIPKIEKDLATVVITNRIKKEGWYVEALDDKLEVIEKLPHNKTITFKNLDPTNTRFRAFNDLNNNGKWNANNPLKRVAPEPIQFYTNEKKEKTVPLRANWTVEIEWNF